MLSRFSLLPAASLLALLTACGGTVAPETVPADPKTNPPDTSCTSDCTNPNDGSIAGSYEVVFTSVSRSDGQTTSGVPLADTRVSITNRARLDVGTPKADGTVDVILTGRWNDVAKFDGKVAGGTLTLRNGKAAFGAGDAATDFYESNTWTELTLPIAASGELAGTFAAKGDLTASAGDVFESFPIVGSGTIAADKRAPALKLEPPRKSRAGQWLPWDPISIRFAEPLRRDAFGAMIASLPEVGWPPIGDASAKPDDPISGLYGWATTFTTNGQTRTLTAPSGVTDPNKNALEPFSAEISFRDVGAAKARHELDAGFASWGTAATASDARCESGACVVFPAEDQSHCGTASGIAGRLALAGGGPITKVHARVRLLAGSTMTDAQPYVVDALRFEVATASGVQAGSLQQLPLVHDGTGDTPWQSAWTTIDVPVSGAEAGFSFVRSACDSLGGLPLPEAKVALIVDAVWAD